MDSVESADSDSDKPNGKLCERNHVAPFKNNNNVTALNRERVHLLTVDSAKLQNNSKESHCQRQRTYEVADTQKKRFVKNEKSNLHVQFHQDEPEGQKQPPEPQQTQQRAGRQDSTSSSSSCTTESSSDEESSLEHYSEARAPDGGWGWVVVAAAFFVNLIADGVTFSFGIIFVEFLEYFGEAKSKTAWIGSLFMAMPLLSGPIASFLTDRFGCRRVSIFGAILAAIGFIISSFTDSIEVLFLTFGVFAGFGLSLCYVAAVVIVAYYFDKKRSFATGLSVCGSGIGTFIFAPLTQMLLDEYGWRGTTLILAGLFLNMCVCGALMRDLPWTKAKMLENRQKRRRLRSAGTPKSSAESIPAPTQLKPDELRRILNSGGQVPDNSTAAEAAAALAKEQENRLSTSLVNIPTFVRSGERVPWEVLELLTQRRYAYSVCLIRHHVRVVVSYRNVYSTLVQNYPSLMISSRSCSDSGLFAAGTEGKASRLPTSPLAAPPPPADNAQPAPSDVWSMKRSDSTQRRVPTAYLKDLRVHRHSLTYRGAMLNINRYRLRASSCPDIYRNSMTTIAKEKHEWYSGLYDLKELVIDMLDLSHFLDIRFLLFAISNFLLYTWYDVPYVYLADNAIKIGFTEKDASYLISVIGILNMVGEIVLGWAGDRPWVNPHLVYALCMALCGAVTALIPLISAYTPLCVLSGAFGLFIAANYSLTSIILVEMITIDRFTNAYGLLLLVQGVANLIGPPLAGWLYDLTDQYDLSFYLSGLFIVLSGVMLLIVPIADLMKKPVQKKCLPENNNDPEDKNTIPVDALYGGQHV